MEKWNVFIDPMRLAPRSSVVSARVTFTPEQRRDPNPASEGVDIY